MKKFLKITLGLLTLLFVIVIGTGIVVKETTYEVKIEVNKPIDEVFALFNDKNKLKEWTPTIKLFEPINETANHVGSTYKVIVDNNGKDFEMTEKVLAFEKNKKVSIEFDAQGMLKTDVITFKSVGNKTIITNNASCKGTNFMLKCIFPFSKGMFKKEDQKYLDNFKKFAEAQVETVKVALSK